MKKEIDKLHPQATVLAGNQNIVILWHSVVYDKLMMLTLTQYSSWEPKKDQIIYFAKINCVEH